MSTDAETKKAGWGEKVTVRLPPAHLKHLDALVEYVGTLRDSQYSFNEPKKQHVVFVLPERWTHWHRVTRSSVLDDLVTAVRLQAEPPPPPKDLEAAAASTKRQVDRVAKALKKVRKVPRPSKRRTARSQRRTSKASQRRTSKARAKKGGRR